MKPIKRCKKCIMPETTPHITLDENGVCNICMESEQMRFENAAFSDFSTKQRLQIFQKKVDKLKGTGRYDCAVSISGGKDSMKALDIAVNVLNLKPLAIFIDNGYTVPEMAQNIKRITDALSVDMIQFKCHDVKEIFKILLQSKRSIYYCRVCHALLDFLVSDISSKYGIPLVLGGYTKGQNYIAQSELFWIYKESDENAAALLEDSPYSKYAELVRDSRVFFAKHYSQIAKLAVFKYFEYDEDKIIAEITEKYGFRLPEHSWPKKSTNCTFNFVAQYMATRQFGYTQHETELSQLVREGEMTRENALNICTQIIDDDLEDPLAVLGLCLQDII